MKLQLTFKTLEITRKYTFKIKYKLPNELIETTN